MDTNKQRGSECCPKFDPSPWNGKILKWENKKFIKAPVFTFFYIPINFGSVITKLTKKIDQSGAKFVDAMCPVDLLAFSVIGVGGTKSICSL